MAGFGEDGFGNVESVPFLDNDIEVGRERDAGEESLQLDITNELAQQDKHAEADNITLDETTQLQDVSEIPLDMDQVRPPLCLCCRSCS